MLLRNIIMCRFGFTGSSIPRRLCCLFIRIGVEISADRRPTKQVQLRSRFSSCLPFSQNNTNRQTNSIHHNNNLTTFPTYHIFCGTFTTLSSTILLTNKLISATKPSSSSINRSSWDLEGRKHLAKRSNSTRSTLGSPHRTKSSSTGTSSPPSSSRRCRW